MPPGSHEEAKSRVIIESSCKKGEGWFWPDHAIQNGTTSVHNRAVKENMHRKDSSA
jgi:hypothetical protein